MATTLAQVKNKARSYELGKDTAQYHFSLGFIDQTPDISEVAPCSESFRCGYKAGRAALYNNGHHFSSFPTIVDSREVYPNNEAIQKTETQMHTAD
jgi:hypothetical protein